MPPTPPPDDWAWALAKFAVIAPLVCRQLDRAETHALRREILAAVHQFPSGPPRRVAARTLRAWCQHYRQANLEGLTRRTRKDKGVPRVIPPAILAKALALRDELATRSAQTLADRLSPEAGTPIAAKTLAYHLRRTGPLRATATPPKAFRRFEHPRPNACWQSDLSDGLWLPDPADPAKVRKCYLHAFIDDHSRLVPHAQFYWSENLPALEDCFRQAILKYGLPSICYWDNGSVFRADQLRRMAARLGIQVVFSTAYAPEGRGKIERRFGHAKRAFYPEAQHAGLRTLDELNTFWFAWLETHYQTKVHAETGQTPRDRWEAGRHHVRFATPDEIADTFLWEETRIVRKTGTISLAGNHYDVDALLIGQRVTVRFDPFDLATIQVVGGGQVVGIARPRVLVARTFSPARPRTPTTPTTLASAQAFRDQVVAAAAPARDPLGGATGPPSELLTADALLAAVTHALAPRTLTLADATAIRAFWSRHAPLRATTATWALRGAVAAKGTDRHVSFYLDAVRELHWEVTP